MLNILYALPCETDLLRYGVLVVDAKEHSLKCVCIYICMYVGMYAEPLGKFRLF